MLTFISYLKGYQKVIEWKYKVILIPARTFV